MKTFKIFGFLSRLSLITRWSLMFNTRPENVAEHSWNVTTIAHALAVIRNRGPVTVEEFRTFVLETGDYCS